MQHRRLSPRGHGLPGSSGGISGSDERAGGRYERSSGGDDNATNLRPTDHAGAVMGSAGGHGGAGEPILGVSQRPVKRSLDPVPFNIMANLPDVRPFLGGVGELDLSDLVKNPENFAFLTPNNDGGYICVKLAPGLFQAHTLSLPSARGKPMLSLMRDGFATMFMSTDAIEISTLVPDGAEAADRWANVAGFRETFRREAFFPLMDQMVGGSFRSLHYADWVLRDPNNKRLGEAFHVKLEAAQGHANHPDDPVHDHWVGATLGGCMEGNPHKALGLYSRWASQAGYMPAKIVTVNPLVVDVGDSLVQFLSGQVDILSVKP